MNRVGHAFFKRADARGERDLRRRGHRALLLPRQLLRRQRLHPGAADPRADVAQGADAAPSCSRRCARSTSSPARSTRGSATCDGAREARRARGASTPGRPRLLARRHSRRSIPTGTSTSAASNTEPMLRLNLEATTQKMMEQKRDEVLAFIRWIVQLAGSELVIWHRSADLTILPASGLSIVVMSWLPKPVRRVRSP